jgi:hypothetical protein
VRLYHFTGLVHLSAIMREGLRKGEVPIRPRGDVPQAVNLTALPERSSQTGWGGGCGFDKTALRITVELHPQKIESFKEVRARFKIPSGYAKLLNKGGGADPYNHFFYFGVIPPSDFLSVELFDGSVLRGT